MITKIIYTFFLLLTICCAFNASGQAKIGDNKTVIQPGSLLELETTNKGLLNVRLNTTQMLSVPVSAASKGLMVYNTDSACLCLYDGTNWKNMCTSNVRQAKTTYIANTGDYIFNAPEIIYSENNVQVFRNGVQINFSATLGTNIVQLEADAICKKDDEIKIIQLVNR
jgi:hypothetical protein